MKNQPEKMYVGIKALLFRGRETGQIEVFMLRAKSSVLGENGWRWDIPGGRIDENETEPAVTLKRELGEEIPGVKDIQVEQILGIELVARASLKSRVALCYYRVKADLSQIKIGDEHLAAEWIAIDEVEKLRNSDGQRPDWLDIFQKINWKLITW